MLYNLLYETRYSHLEAEAGENRYMKHGNAARQTRRNKTIRKIHPKVSDARKWEFTRKAAALLVLVLLVDLVVLLNLGPASSRFPLRPTKLYSIDISSPTICVDDDSNSYIVWSYDSDSNDKADTLYFKKLDSSGDLKISKKLTEMRAGARSPQMILDNENFLQLFWIQEDSYHLFYTKLDLDGKEITPAKKIMDYTFRGSWYRHLDLQVDGGNRIHMLNKFGYFLLDDGGNILGENTDLASSWDNYPWGTGCSYVVDSAMRSHIFIGDGLLISSVILDTVNDTILVRQEKRELCKGGSMRILGFDSSGKINFLLSLNEVYHPDSEGNFNFTFYLLSEEDEILVTRNLTSTVYPDLCALDSQDNLVLVWSDDNSCGGKDAHFHYCRMDRNGSVIIPDRTFLSIDANMGLIMSHGPSIFKLDMVLDPRDQVHLVWIINHGDNSYSLQYAQVDDTGKSRHKDMDFGKEAETICDMVCLGILLLLVNVKIFSKFEFRKKQLPGRLQRPRPPLITSRALYRYSPDDSPAPSSISKESREDLEESQFRPSLPTLEEQ